MDGSDEVQVDAIPPEFEGIPIERLPPLIRVLAMGTAKKDIPEEWRQRIDAKIRRLPDRYLFKRPPYPLQVTDRMSGTPETAGQICRLCCFFATALNGSKDDCEALKAVLRRKLGDISVEAESGEEEELDEHHDEGTEGEAVDEAATDTGAEMHLYVMMNKRIPNEFKIGKARNVFRRKQQLEESQNFTIQIMLIARGCGNHESAIHRILRHKRYLACRSVEWFVCSLEEIKAALLRVVPLGAIEAGE